MTATPSLLVRAAFFALTLLCATVAGAEGDLGGTGPGWVLFEMTALEDAAVGVEFEGRTPVSGLVVLIDEYGGQNSSVITAEPVGVRANAQVAGSADTRGIRQTGSFHGTAGFLPEPRHYLAYGVTVGDEDMIWSIATQNVVDIREISRGTRTGQLHAHDFEGSQVSATVPLAGAQIAAGSTARVLVEETLLLWVDILYNDKDMGSSLRGPAGTEPCYCSPIADRPPGEYAFVPPKVGTSSGGPILVWADVTPPPAMTP